MDEWLNLFKAEFKRRTGITWAESGNTDEDAKRWHDPDSVGLRFEEASIGDAVGAYIEKYDLIDLADPVY